MTPEDIKKRINLANYIRGCGIELKPHGKTDLIGHCPFHDDSTPFSCRYSLQTTLPLFRLQ